MISRLKYYKQLYQKFGMKAVWFLVMSKLLKDRLANRRILNVHYPIQLSNFTADVTTLFQIFYGREYEIKDKMDPDFIIDCGANIGLSAVWFANEYPKAKIIAIEPDLNNFSFLKKNTAGYLNVACLNKAVWSHETSMAIIDKGTGNWSLQTIESKNNTGDDVDAVTISKIMKDFQISFIDILKIDIEGAEKELFSNSCEYWLAKTGLVAIELHDNIDEQITSIFYKAISGKKYKKYYNGENLIVDFR